jgi:hypothetical protein
MPARYFNGWLRNRLGGVGKVLVAFLARTDGVLLVLEMITEFVNNRDNEERPIREVIRETRILIRSADMLLQKMECGLEWVIMLLE